MNLFGEITNTRRTNEGLINPDLFFTMRNKTASKEYASELIKRNGLSDQQKLYENELYALFTSSKTNKALYFREKNIDLERKADQLKDDFRKSYKKALQEGYSQSAAENIAQRKTNKKKEVLMQEHKSEYPF